MGSIPFHHELAGGEIPLAGQWSGSERGTHPFVTEEGESRRYALVHVPHVDGGTRLLPFYSHSGSNPKEGVSQGDWLPYFGHHEETGWLNKVSGVENSYGSKSLARVGEGLSRLAPEGPVPRGGQPAIDHINGILRSQWGIGELGRGPSDPIATSNARQILKQIKHG